MQQRSTLRRRDFSRALTRIASVLGVVALVVGSGLLGASTATAADGNPSLFGDFGSNEAEVYLYSTSGGAVTSSIPVNWNSKFNNFEFDEVASGTYAIAFRDGTTGKWLPWLSHTDGSGADATGGASACLLNVTVADDDIDFGSVTLGSGATSSCGAPWGTASSFSGTISNMLPAAAVSAWLYYVDVDDDLLPVNRAPVGSNGDYSVDGVSLAGQYVVLLRIDDEDSPFLDTWSDGSDASEWVTDSEYYYELAAPATGPVGIDSDSDYSAPPNALVPAAVLSGRVTDSHGSAISGMTVEATVAPGQSGDYYSSALTNPNGDYSLQVKLGVRYVLDASGPTYAQAFWPYAEDVGDAVAVSASTPGAYPTAFNFSLTKLKTDFTGLVLKIDPDGNPETFPHITAFLYKHVGKFWKKIATQSADVGDEGVNEFDFSASHISALNAGDFRLRFHTPSGWVAIAYYGEADDSDFDSAPQFVEGPTCFISLLNVVLGQQTDVGAVVDPTDTTTKCGDEPQPPSSRPLAVTSDAFRSTSSPNPSVTPTPTPTPTDAATQAPTDVAAPTSSPAPVVASSTTGLPAWLWWALGGLIVVIAGVIIWLIVVRPRI